MSKKAAKNYVLDAETGKYDYIGMRYYVMADEADWKRLRVWGTAAAIGLIALFLLSGLWVYGGMNTFYVLAPNVLLMVLAFWLSYQMAKICRKPMELTEAANNRLMHITWSSLACAAMGALAVIAHLVYSLLNGWSDGDVRFMVLMGLCVPLGLLVFVLVRKCPTEQLLIDDLPDEIPEFDE